MESGNGSDEDEYFTPEGSPPTHRSLLNLDRDRGILTPADRRVLVGKADFPPGSNSMRKARQRIRDRIRDSMLDFYILLNYLEERDLKLAFNQSGPEPVSYDDVISVFPAAIGFLYAASIANPKVDESTFATRVQQGITNAEVVRNNATATVNVSITVDRGEPLEELAARVREQGIGADVSPEQMNMLLATGEVDRDLYAKVMERLLQ